MKFEYLCTSLDDRVNLKGSLNAWGAKGWELVAIRTFPVSNSLPISEYIFKRPITEGGS